MGSPRRFGPSSHDDDSYYLIRAFLTEEERRRALEILYESQEWLREYDERVMGLIESYQTAVVVTSPQAVEALIGASRQTSG